MYRELKSSIGTMWCNLMHESMDWPAHGSYRCRICGRSYPAFADAPTANRLNRVAWKPVVPIALAMLLLPFAAPVHAAESIKGRAPSEAEAAFQQYLAAGPASPWALEYVDIHAALPDMAETGSLQAIRTLSTGREGSYQVIQFAGDRTVRDQVISRYLHAQQRASELPAASLAITPANYKFAYKGMVDDGELQAFAFQITPRSKREGLFKGEIWLDRQTGAPVRQSGRFVKSPSFFIKRVTVVQNNAMRDGIIASRLTHITVDVRLVGRAELVIQERPLTSADRAQISNWRKEGGER